MPSQILVNEPNLDVVTIDDFTPGIFNGAHSGPQYSTAAPLGSCATSYRCYARQGIGLRPLPTYTTIFSFGFPTTGSVQVGTYNFITIGTLLVQPGYYPGDSVTYTLRAYNANIGGGAPVSAFYLDTLLYTGAGWFRTNQYYSNGAANPSGGSIWAGLAPGFWTQSGRVTQGAFTVDPNPTSSMIWVATPNPSAAGTYLTGSIANATPNAIRPAFVNGRMVFITPLTGYTSNGGTIDSFITSDIQSATNFVTGEYFNPETGGLIGAYGSVSTGEFIIIYANGGATVVSGDIQNPSSAIYLPGVTGTGLASGPAVPTPIGLVYVSDYDGAWVWNGGNTSQKISNAIVDTALIRADGPPQYGPTLSGLNVSNGCWSNWVMFANNYMFDCVTGSWWLMEDPSVNLFTVHGQSPGSSGRFFYSASAAQINQGTGAIYQPIVQWNQSVPSSSFRWISNPIPARGGIISMQAVEICASNTSSTACTVKITPTAPPGGIVIPGNQNANQSITFTIPAHTVAYRASQRLGYTDYNMCFQVDASNSNGNNPAPTIHDISIGYDRTTSMAA